MNYSEIEKDLTKARIKAIRKSQLKRAAWFTALIACLFFWHVFFQWVRS